MAHLPSSNAATHRSPVENLSGDIPDRCPLSGVSILIVGGGVAGLMAGLECWRKGHDVRIVEKASSRLLTGDGFTIGPSAIRALQVWPEMAKENEVISIEPWVSWHKINGEQISAPEPLHFNPSKSISGETIAPPKIYRHSRPKMHKMLVDQLERIGILIEYGKYVIDYYEDIDSGKAGVILKNNEKLEADVVIAADGIGSHSSRITLGHEAQARPTGFSIYRAAYSLDDTQLDPVLDKKFPMLENGLPATQIWMGDGVHAVFGRSSDEMTWFLTYPNRGHSTESWSGLVDPETVLQTTATIDGWPDYANRLIQQTPKGHIHDFKLMWREPQSFWTSPGGRVIQIGDAAHTFLPSSGNGATQGIEDAVTLATCLQIAGKENIPSAARVHNTLRFERVSCLQLLGVLNHITRHSSADAQTSQAKPVGLMGAWIWNHNPEKYATDNYYQALAHLTSGTLFQNTNTPPGYSPKPWSIDELLKARENGEEFTLEGDWE